MRLRLSPASYSSTSRIRRVTPEASPNLGGLLAAGRDLGRVGDVRARHLCASAAGAPEVCSELDSRVTLGRSSRAIKGGAATPENQQKPGQTPDGSAEMPATASTGPVNTTISAAPNQRRPSRPRLRRGARRSGKCLTAKSDPSELPQPVARPGNRAAGLPGGLTRRPLSRWTIEQLRDAVRRNRSRPLPRVVVGREHLEHQRRSRYVHRVGSGLDGPRARHPVVIGLTDSCPVDPIVPPVCVTLRWTWSTVRAPCGAGALDARSSSPARSTPR